jgi:tetratricopeptide (TPR) repeat protein
MAQGQLHYWLGYSQWKLGDAGEAERLLRVARDFMKVRHPTDADAAYTLGRIRQEKRDYREATAFYESVLVSHPDSPVALLAKLGRGLCRVSLGEDHAGLNDLQTLVNEVVAKPAHKRRTPEVVAGLRDAAATLATRDNFEGALEVMAYEQRLTPAPAGEFFARLATVYERRAEQVEGSVDAAPNSDERFRRQDQTRALRTKAGDAYIAYAKSLGGDEDDKGYGSAIWKAVDLYDRAGSLPLSIAALELFAAERPSDGLAPDALLRLGRAYQAAGHFDKAIEKLQRTSTATRRAWRRASRACRWRRRTSPRAPRPTARPSARSRPSSRTTRSSRPTPTSSARRCTSWRSSTTAPSGSRRPSPGSRRWSSATRTTSGWRSSCS